MSCSTIETSSRARGHRRRSAGPRRRLAAACLALLLFGPLGCARAPLSDGSSGSSGSVARRDGGHLAGGARDGGGSRVALRLTVLHASDPESQLLHAGSGLEDFGGAARWVGLVRQLRRGATARTGPGEAGVVAILAGDSFLAGPELAVSLERGPPFLDSVALARAGLDAVVLGNHDFDFGPDVLADFIEGFEPPVPFLSANLDVSEEPRLAGLAEAGRIRGSVVVETGQHRVGIVGVTTPRLRELSRPGRVRVLEPARPAQAAVRSLLEDGVDVVVLAGHLQSLRRDAELLGRLRGVDVVVAGGGGELLAGPFDALLPGDVPDAPYPWWAVDAEGRRVPVVTTPGDYRYVGRLVAGFDEAGCLVEIDRARSGPVRVAGGEHRDAVAPDLVVEARVSRAVRTALDELGREVVAVSEVALDARRVAVRTGATNAGDLVADAVLWKARALARSQGLPVPEAALVNGGSLRIDAILGPGPIHELDTFELLPFPDFVVLVPELPRARLLEVLENALSRVEERDGRFPHVAGLRVAWDPSGAARRVDPSTGQLLERGRRVRDVRLVRGPERGSTRLVRDGRVVPGPPVTLATSGFLARGGDGMPLADLDSVSLGVPQRQALRDFLAEQLGGRVTGRRDPRGGDGRLVTVGRGRDAPAGPRSRHGIGRVDVDRPAAETRGGIVPGQSPPDELEHRRRSSPESP